MVLTFEKFRLDKMWQIALSLLLFCFFGVSSSLANNEDDWDPRYAVSTRYTKSRNGKTINWYLMYTDQADVTKLFSDGLFPGVTITGCAETNSILIRSDDPENPVRDEVIDFLNSIDIRPAQVLVDVLVVDFTVSNNRLFDLEFKQLVQNPLGTNRTTGTIVGDLGSIELSDPSVNTDGLKIFATSSDKVKAFINARQEMNMAEIISSPHVVASNNEKAFFEIGKTISVRESSTSLSFENSTLDTYFRDKVGLSLEVTPQINRSGMVGLEIAQSINDVVAYDMETGRADTAQRSIKTNAVVKDGETLILGGFIEKKTSTSKQKFPVLSKIPLIGKAFRGTSRTVRKSELMVFITPHILNTSEEKQQVIKQKTERISSKKKVRELIEKADINKVSEYNGTILIDRGLRNWQYDFDTKEIIELCWDIPESLDPEKIKLTRAGACPFAYGQGSNLKPPTFRTQLKPCEGFAFKKEFFVEDPQVFSALSLKVASKNAAVIYLNGTLIDEDRMMKLVDGHDFDNWNSINDKVPARLLKKGRNVLVALLGNDKSTSGAYFDMMLEGLPITLIKAVK